MSHHGKMTGGVYAVSTTPVKPGDILYKAGKGKVKSKKSKKSPPIGVAFSSSGSGDVIKIELFGTATLSSNIAYGDDEVETYGMKVIKRAPYVDLTFEQLPEKHIDTYGQFLHNARVIKVYLGMFKRNPELVLTTVEHEAIHVGMDDLDNFELDEEDMIDAVLQARWEGDLM